MKLKLSLILVLIPFTLIGQIRDTKQVKFGFQINQFQDDFGLGIHVISPEFKNLSISLKANTNWLQGISPKTENQNWYHYYNGQIAIRYRSPISEKVGIYAEGGLFVAVPNPDFSDQDFSPGGFGLFGFEFFIGTGKRVPSYFIELGGIGSGSTAEKLPSNPIYANGFLIATGFRF
jgi:hypothetical protein